MRAAQAFVEEYRGVRITAVDRGIGTFFRFEVLFSSGGYEGSPCLIPSIPHLQTDDPVMALLAGKIRVDENQ